MAETSNAEEEGIVGLALKINVIFNTKNELDCILFDIYIQIELCICSRKLKR